MHTYMRVDNDYRSDPYTDKTHLHHEAQVTVTKENVLRPPGCIPTNEVEKTIN